MPRNCWIIGYLRYNPFSTRCYPYEGGWEFDIHVQGCNTNHGPNCWNGNLSWTFGRGVSSQQATLMPEFTAYDKVHKDKVATMGDPVKSLITQPIIPMTGVRSLFQLTIKINSWMSWPQIVLVSRQPRNSPQWWLGSGEKQLAPMAYPAECQVADSTCQ